MRLSTVAVVSLTFLLVACQGDSPTGPSTQAAITVSVSPDSGTAEASCYLVETHGLKAKPLSTVAIDMELMERVIKGGILPASLFPLDLLELRWLSDHEAHRPCCSYLHGMRIHKPGHYLLG